MPRPKLDPPRGVLKTLIVPGQRFRHERYHPSSDLAAFVEHYWSVRWYLRGLPPHRVETLPHPSVHLIFDADAGCRIAGVARGKFSRELHGDGGVFAAKFRPGGFFPFVGRSIAGFTDREVTLRSVWGADGAALERAILALDDDDARMACLEEFLRSRAPQPHADAQRTGAIVLAIAADRDLVTVDDVAARFAVTVRGLQRRFARYVGVPPKWVLLRYRLHEAAAQLAQRPASQAALAVELGYADQAAFIKAWKAIVGISPAAYAKRSGA